MGAQKNLKDLKSLMKDGRGSATVATSNENVTVTRWLDNKLVHVMSSYAGKEPLDKVNRYDRVQKKVIEVKRPYAISEYNKFMGGIDLNDRMVAHYPHGLKNKKFYLRIFYHILNVAIVNAWIVQNTVLKSEMSLVDFKIDICQTIFDMCKSVKKRGRPSQELEPVVKRRARPGCSNELRLHSGGHYPEKRELQNAPRCRDKNCHRRTRYFCMRCDIPICPECMRNFHS